VVQARPETVRSRQKEGSLTSVSVAGHGPEVIEGVAIGKSRCLLLLGIFLLEPHILNGLPCHTITGSDAACGTARVITDLGAISTMKPGEILIADMTDPDWVPAIRIASAVVTNRGGRTCHAAIVSRELGVPCIVGTKDATEILKTGGTYTIDCSQGSRGLVYHGTSEIVRTEIDISDLPTTDTKIQLILGDPDAALTHASLPVKGVGLVRQEFVVANHIGIHPNAVLKPELVKEADWALITERAINDPSPVDFFIRKLAEGIGSIGAAFYPRPIIVRLGDFKSNEYCRLIGGQKFEVNTPCL